MVKVFNFMVQNIIKCSNFQTMSEVLKSNVDISEALIKLVTTQDNIMQFVAAKILFLLVESDRLVVCNDSITQ